MNIGILTGCPSDHHLAMEIHSELIKLGGFPGFIELSQNSIVNSYHRANFCFGSHDYDFVLAVGDRKEQIGGVLAAFQNGIPVGHLYAGDLNTGVSDDIHRPAITLYSNIQFCSCPESAKNVEKLMRAAGLVPDANVVGATHFDGKSLEEISKYECESINLKPYILILINSETNGDDKKLVEETLEKLKYFFPDEHPCKFNFIIAKGNLDNEDIEKKVYCELHKRSLNAKMNNRQIHDHFLSLISNCYMFVTNSSAAIYEAPLLIPQEHIVMIGNRNKVRTKIPIESHNGMASKLVAKLIKTFLESRK